jgi:hypothetical protein
MPATHPDIVNAELLAFIREEEAPVEQGRGELSSATRAPVPA